MQEKIHKFEVKEWGSSNPYGKGEFNQHMSMNIKNIFFGIVVFATFHK